MADQDRLNQLYRQAEAKRLVIAKILFSPNAWVYPDKHAARLSAAVSEFVGIIGQHEEALKVGAHQKGNNGNDIRETAGG